MLRTGLRRARGPKAAESARAAAAGASQYQRQADEHRLVGQHRLTESTSAHFGCPPNWVPSSMAICALVR